MPQAEPQLAPPLNASGRQYRVGNRMISRDPKVDARLEAEYYAENQRVPRLLETKGFSVEGDELGGGQITLLRARRLSGGASGHMPAPAC